MNYVTFTIASRCKWRGDPEVFGFNPTGHENNCRKSFNSGLLRYARKDGLN